MGRNKESFMDKASSCLLNHQMKGAIHEVRQAMIDYPETRQMDRLDAIERDYDLMLDYMRRGFADPQRESFYQQLSFRMVDLIKDMVILHRHHQNPFFSYVVKQGQKYNFSHEMIRSSLESFVTDMAMLSLESEEIQREKSRKLTIDHHELMSSLFCYLVSGLSFTEQDEQFYINLLQSPSVDSRDAQLLVSAIMLAVLNQYDLRKFNTLLQLYLHATDEHVRQRALVGWALCMKRDLNIEGELELEDRRHVELLKGVLQDEQVIQDLFDLQKQMVLCLNAERDTEDIQRDIMPTLMKNRNFDITRNGIVEREDDPMEDILNPGAADQRMEELEASIQRMMNMQKAGSDIYFSGFSQMKRFSFFYELPNWFAPFYVEHPGIASVADKLKESKFLSYLLHHGPFCDSDKYSFALGLSKIVSQLPKDMMELLNQNDAFGPVMSEEEIRHPAYIRRLYMQDLYRFFRLHPDKSHFVNGMDEEHAIFANASLFRDTPMMNYMTSLYYFFHKYNKLEAASRTIWMMEEVKTEESYICQAKHFLENFPEDSSDSIERLLEQAPDSEQLMSLCARANKYANHYDRAAELYHQLTEKFPDKFSYKFNYSVALSCAQRYTEASELLYQFYYEQPDNLDIQRILAWNEMGLERYDKAWALYDKLLQQDIPTETDYLNAGYCKWFQNDIKEAAFMFRLNQEFVVNDYPEGNILDLLLEDKQFLNNHGITDAELYMMAEIV